MNAMHKQIAQEDDACLTLVDFKWLMAGWGWWVDLSRLRRDKAYAGECIEHALNSGSELLRQRSVALLPFVARTGAPGSVSTHAASGL